MLFQLAIFCLLTVTQEGGGHPVLTGVVLDSRDQPVAGAIVEARPWMWWATEPIMEQIATQTDVEGKFRLELPIEEKLLPIISLAAHNDEQTELGFCSIGQLGEYTSEEVTIRLSEPRSVRIEVRNPENLPIEDATTSLTFKIAGVLVHEHGMRAYDSIHLPPQTTDSAGIAEYQIPQNAQIISTIALKPGYSVASSEFEKVEPNGSNQVADFPSSFPASGTETLVIAESPPTTIRVVGVNQQPVAGAKVIPQGGVDSANNARLPNVFLLGDASREWTDSNGEANFTWLPKNGWASVRIEAEGYESTWHKVDLQEAAETSVVQLQPLVSIGGLVRSDTGQPLSGVELTAIGLDHSNYASKMYSASTDVGGKFVMEVPAEKVYQVIVNDPAWAAEVQTNVVVTAEAPSKELIFSASKPTKVFGLVTQEETGEPIAGVKLQVTYRDEYRVTTDVEGYPKPTGTARARSESHQFETKTDSEGRYAFALGDGKYRISLVNGSGGSQDFDIRGQDSLEMELWTTMKEKMRFRLTGQIVEHASGRPLPWSQVVVGVSNVVGKYTGTADHQGRFEVTLICSPRGDGSEALGLVSVFGVSADGNLFGVLELMRKVDHCTLSLAPPTSIVGQLIGPDEEIPWGNAQIRYRQFFVDRKLPANVNTGTVSTDEDGFFRIDSLTSGQQYELLYEPEPEQAAPSGRQRGRISRTISLGKITASDQNSEIIKVRIPAPIGPIATPSMQARIDRMLASTKDALRAFRMVTAKPANRPLIVLFGSADDPRTLETMECRFEKARRGSNLLRGYRLLLLARNSSEASSVAVELGVIDLYETLDGASDVMMVVLDRDNTVRKTIKGNDIFMGNVLSLPRLERFLALPD